VQAVEELVKLGPSALQPLFERLCASQGGDSPLGALQLATLHGALARLPREGCLTLLARETRASDDRRREAALEVVGRLGGKGELKLALDLGTPAERESPPEAALSAALERALLGLCEREEGTARALASLYPRVPPSVQTSIAAIVARTGGEEASTLLGTMLGNASAAADAILLLELAQSSPWGASEDTLLLERVRGILGHPDARLRVLACLAVEKLRDHEAVPDLVVLLEDRDPNLRRRAHAALSSLTGLSLPPDHEGWLTWLSEGLAWWDERAEPCRIALVSGTTVEAAESVRELARQRLFVHHAAGILALAVQRPEPDIVKSACIALGTMRESAAQQALLSVVTHPDPAIAEEARAALRRLARARTPDVSPKATLPRLNRSLP
jgi:HEAT repeat protein